VADSRVVEASEVADNRLKVADNRVVEVSRLADNRPRLADRPWDNGCRTSTRARDSQDTEDQADHRGKPVLLELPLSRCHPTQVSCKE